MNDLMAKLLKLKTPGKIGVLIVVVAVFTFGFNSMFLGDVEDGIAAAIGQRDALREERASYERRKAEYMTYRNELNQLQEQQRELLRALPKEQEIPSFVGSIQEQAELSGLEMLNLAIDEEIPEQLYIKIPVKMEVRGSYHAVTRFFKNIAQLRRIVNVENLSLTPERKPNDAEDAPVKLVAKFIAATFRYNDNKPQTGG
jgi:type IV pilus assembly protein PilO